MYFIKSYKYSLSDKVPLTGGELKNISDETQPFGKSSDKNKLNEELSIASTTAMPFKLYQSSSSCVRYLGYGGIL